MADAAESHNIARRTFEVSRRGYEQQQVRGYLHEVQALVDRLQRELAQVRERAERAEARLEITGGPDEAMLLEVLGEETTRVLTSAREAAAEIRSKAEAAAERIVSEATAEASETRADAMREAERRLAEAAAEHESLVAEARTELDRRQAEAQEAAALIRSEAAEQAQALRDEGQRDLERTREEAEGELEDARTQGKQMVAEAQAVRERLLRDLSARRKKARLQVEKLNAGRERLLEAYAVVRRTLDEATSELSTSLTDARLAADAAARRVEEEPDPTLEQLDDEIRAAGLVDLPIVDVDDDDASTGEGDAAEADEGPSPLSGEVPVVDAPAAEAEPSAAPEPAAPVDLGERRGRKRRKRDTFEGLPAGELTKVELPAEDEGVRVIAEPNTADAEPIEEGPEAAEDEEEPPADAEQATEDDAGAESPVDDLFARLRAQSDDDDGSEAAEVEVEVEAADAADDSAGSVDAEDEPAAVEPEDEPEAATPFTERDALLDPVDKELGRRLKRALADEQNEVLDLLRRAKPKGVDDLLPAADEHATRWVQVVSEVLSDAATAGATWAGGTPGSIEELADDLARSLTAPLRDRIDRSFSASDGNLDDVADRVRALYREWKGQRLTDTSRHYSAAAYARGVFDAAGEGAQVHWVLDPLGGPCPDCDDNVLGGTVTKGTEFPTGHACAPAHPGCRCLVLAADR
ncbi:MAG: DivIVA domain-containing protein [Acidimicrobiales bacterium]